MRATSLSLLRIGFAAVLLAALSHTRADPDLWGHIYFGRETVTSGSITAIDTHSFLSDREWINHEWLSECAMYLAYAAAGGVGLVLLKLVLLGAMADALITALRRWDLEPPARDLLLAIALIGTFAQANHMRPQVFSLAAFAWLLMLLTEAGRGAHRRLLIVPALMALWVNLHGGWIIGGGTLAIWIVFTLFGTTSPSEKRQLIIAGVLGLAATLVSPYGWNMWLFLWKTVAFGRDEITDWQPVFRMGPGVLLIWSVLAIAAAAAVTRSLATAARHSRKIAVVVLLGVGAFWVNRLTAFFALALVMLLGDELAATLARLRAATKNTRAERASLAIATSLVIGFAIIGGSVVASARNVDCVRMDSAGLPEPEVVDLVDRLRLRGRLLVWFDWGEYAIWHMGRSLSVSVDGRRETVYSEDVLRRHLEFYFVPSTRAAFLREVRPDYIWLPAHLPVVERLRDDGWVPIFAGPRSVLLARSGKRVTLSHVVPAARCFPGP